MWKWGWYPASGAMGSGGQQSSAGRWVAAVDGGPYGGVMQLRWPATANVRPMYHMRNMGLWDYSPYGVRSICHPMAHELCDIAATVIAHDIVLVLCSIL